MVDQEKLSKDFEEQIQSLAGDIYLQVEDKVSDMLDTLIPSLELTDEKIETHKHYIKLKEANQIQQTELEHARATHQAEVDELNAKLDQLNEKLNSTETELNNYKESTGNKLSDTEVVLKAKLDEISMLTKKLKTYTEQAPKTAEKIAAAEKEIQTLKASNEKLIKSEANLTKSDSAKVVALDLQSKQISELQLKNNNLSSELEQTQLEQSQQADLQSKNQAQNKKQLEESLQKIDELTKQLAQVEADKQKVNSSDKEQQKAIDALNKQNENLNKEIASLKSAMTHSREQQQVVQQQKIAEHNTALEASKQAYQKLSAELQLEKTKRAEQEKHLVTEQQKVAAEQKALEALNKKLTALAQEKQQLSESKLAASDKVSAIEATNKDLQHKYDELNKVQQSLNEKLNTVSQDYQKQISVLNDNLTAKEKAFEEERQAHKVLVLEQANEAEKWQPQIDELQKQLDALRAESEKEQAEENKQLEKLADIESKLEEAQAEHEKALQRIEKTKAKFEKDSDQARETIKYLRDENHEITAKYESRISELEDQLTEYRLRFEYAQKQLVKDS